MINCKLLSIPLTTTCMEFYHNLKIGSLMLNAKLFFLFLFFLAFDFCKITNQPSFRAMHILFNLS